MTWILTDDPIGVATDTLEKLLFKASVCAVPGGSTPGPILTALRDRGRCNHVLFTLVDERHTGTATGGWRTLPPESNTRGLHECLERGADDDPDIVGWALAGDLDDARLSLDTNVPTPDVVLLGMGADGHVASLFPGRPWESAGQRVLAIEDSPKPPPRRLSMSLDLIDRAAHIVVVVRGSAKADAVARAHAGDPDLPTSHLDTPITWIIGPDAAARLPEDP